jgi:ABC-type nickel/cobalt efflux system permease component RcnA
VYAAGAGGLKTSRLECRLTAPAALDERASVSVENGFRADRIGWRELVASGAGVRLVDSPVPATGISDELRAYPDDLLASPPDVREAVLTVEPGTGPAAPAAAAVATNASGTGFLAGAEQRLTDLAGGRALTPFVGLLAVLLALVLGAAHAALPGHGKTVMAAYLAGRRGRARDAVAVGATVTLTHTGGVLVLGLLLTTFAGVAGEAVLGWLGLASGALVVAVGAAALVTALRQRRGQPSAYDVHDHAYGVRGDGDHHRVDRGEARDDHGHGHVHDAVHGAVHHGHAHGGEAHGGHGHGHAHDAGHGAVLHAHAHGGEAHGDHAHDAGHGAVHHDHVHGGEAHGGHAHDAGYGAVHHGHAHGGEAHGGHAHDAGYGAVHHGHEHDGGSDGGPSHAHGGHSHAHGGHSHGSGGHTHDHGPGRWGIAGLGIAGGLVPSPSALVVLLGAIALGRTAFGIVLVLAYGLGMAATLTAAGLLLIRLRDRYAGRFAGRLAGRWRRIAPSASGALVVVVGLGLAGRALATLA